MVRFPFQNNAISTKCLDFGYTAPLPSLKSAQTQKEGLKKDLFAPPPPPSPSLLKNVQAQAEKVPQKATTLGGTSPAPAPLWTLTKLYLLLLCKGFPKKNQYNLKYFVFIVLSNII